MSEKPKDDLIHLHKNSSLIIDGDKKSSHEEFIAHGDKGLSFKYFNKDNKGTQKFSGRQNEDGTFSIKMLDGDKMTEEKYTKAELVKELSKKANDHLKFILDYIKDLKGGAKKKSRKGSKKGSKGGAKKKSRKGSKKGSRKGSKRGSKKW